MSYTKQSFTTGRGSCPVTGAKNWSYLGSETIPELIISYGSFAHKPTTGWVYVGESKSGGSMFVCKDKNKTYTEHFPNLLIQPAPLQKTQVADPALKNRVYRSLLQFCPLSKSHRAHLVRRKLPYQQLCSLLTFGSLPHPRLRPTLALQILKELNLSVDELLSVPGFFLNKKNHLSMGGAEGLLIPSLDHKGRIQALQIRKDKPAEGESRYTWMSSASKGGPSSGAPACFLGNRHAETVWVTEGTFKGASLLLHDWSEATIAVAGVGNVESVLSQLEGLDKVQNVTIVYDADWKTKPGVLRGLARLVEVLQKRKVKVQALGWDPQYGKGIDDAIVAGISVHQLFSIPLNGLLRATRKAHVSSHRLDTEDFLPIWEPPTEKAPTLEELRQETSYEIYHALRKPCGTFTSIAANTGSGKTYSTIRNSPSQTLFVFRNYAALEEAEHEMRDVHGPGTVRVLYGRIAPPSDPSNTAAQKRFQRAGCWSYGEMKKRSERGHSPCQGCPFAPRPQSETGGDEEHKLCPYWEQRLETVNNPTSYLLAVTQSFAHNPSLLQLLPNDETRSFFQEYNQIVIDDCPDFVNFLSRERSLPLKDLVQWLNHPELNPSEPEQGELIDWLRLLHRWFQQEGDAPELETKIRSMSAAISQQEEPVCEQPFEDEWPLRAVNALATWLARHGDVRFTGEGEQRQLLFLQPAYELIQRFKYMTVCHLDATPDEPLLRWFSQLAGMAFEAPKMKRVFPRIIQVPDILWDRSQVQNRKEMIQALTAHVHQEGGIVLGFKNREGEEEHHIALDGHWGFSERGLNCYTGVKSVALLGHYALPLSEVQNVAWQLRALAKSMDALSPDTFVHEKFAEERSYSDVWRPWTRTMHVTQDTFVEHLRRHRHTSGVVQGANRSRNLNAPVYLLSGEPLDGLPWTVPVELATSREFVKLLNLSLETETSEPKPVNASLQALNQKRGEEAQERLMNLMPGVREYANQLGKVPGVRALRSFMGTDGKLISQELAEKARELLLQETNQNELEETLVEKEVPAPSLLFEMGVPDTLYINQKDFKPKPDTLDSKPLRMKNSSKESRVLENSSLPDDVVMDTQQRKEEKNQPSFSPQDSPPGHSFPSEVDVEPLSPEELKMIPPLARVRLGLCDPGKDNGWNKDVIRQVAQTYSVNPSLLYRFIGVQTPSIFLSDRKKL